MNISEWVFTLDTVRFVTAFFGIVFSSFEVRDVIEDKRILMRMGVNGGKLLVANNNIKNESIRLFIQILLLSVAGMSMLWPLTDIHGFEMHPFSMRLVFDRVFMIVATLLLTAKSWFARHTREEIENYWTLQERHKRREGDNRQKV